MLGLKPLANNKIFFTAKVTLNTHFCLNEVKNMLGIASNLLNAGIEVNPGCFGCSKRFTNRVQHFESHLLGICVFRRGHDKFDAIEHVGE